jgi:hypothetical protein
MGTSKLSLQKNAPSILTAAGVAGFIATTALAIRATTKAVDILPIIAQDIEKAKDQEVDENYTEHDRMTEIVKVYAHSSLVLAQVYGPMLAVGSASIVCVLAGHGMMRSRQTSLVAAYAGLDAAYKAYRSRVREEFGEERELDLYREVKKMRIYDSEGEEREIIDLSDVMPSPYARFFDESSNSWSKTPEYNLLFLRAQQDAANDRLRAYGFLFLNEVYESLGLKRSQAGQIVGWRLNGSGDGYVDFGLYNIGDECNRAFVNIIEPAVMLDFNVDGVISI